jgi:hypothetical protein
MWALADERRAAVGAIALIAHAVVRAALDVAVIPSSARRGPPASDPRRESSARS